MAILKNNTFFIVRTFSESDTQSNILFLRKIQKKRLMNLIYHTWSQNHIWVSRWRFGISIFGTQMTIILDLVNKL